jgi:hypothetical protein
MTKSIQGEIEILGDTKETWVRRRDAAEYLGKAASQALNALRAHENETDVDVQSAVQHALADASVPKSAPKLSLEQLAKYCEKPNERAVVFEEGRFRVEVRLKEERIQRVYIEDHRRRDGVELVRVYTYCGKPTTESLAWALRTNMKLTHGSLALAKKNDEECLVLVDTLEKGEAEPARVKESVKAVAHYGDWIEHSLTGLDDF